MKRVFVAAVAAALVVVQAHTAHPQTVQPAPGVIVAPPGSTIVVPPPPPAVVAPAPVIVAPAASPATVTVITTTVAAPRFCGGAYRPDAGTNFGGC